jgi:hypothetical protein
MNAFREGIEKRDLDGLLALFAEDVVFRSPAIYTPYQGRQKVAVLLAAVGEVMEDFHYDREIGAADTADQALVFRARVGEREIEGCDFIHLNDEGLIDEFYVMVRPLSGLMALAETLGRQLGLDGSAQSSEQNAAERSG